MSSVAGKVVVITGAGRGIGRGIAIAYGRCGAQVVVASRSEAPIGRLVAEIHSAGGVAPGLRCDVGQRDEVFTTIERDESQLSSCEGPRRKDHQHEFGSGADRRGRNAGAAYTALSPSK